jgi:hypothetical protein
MSSPNPKNWQQRLQELEAELHQPSSTPPFTEQHQSTNSGDRSLDNWLARSSAWLSNLSTPAKVVVLVGTMVGSLLVVGMVLRLVQLAVQLAILAAIGYVGYRLILAPKPPKD